MKQIREISEQEVREAMEKPYSIIPDVVVYTLHRWEEKGYYQVCDVVLPASLESHLMEWYCTLLLARTHPKAGEVLPGEYWLCDLVRSSDIQNEFKVHPKRILQTEVEVTEKAGL